MVLLWSVVYNLKLFDTWGFSDVTVFRGMNGRASGVVGRG